MKRSAWCRQLGLIWKIKLSKVVKNQCPVQSAENLETFWGQRFPTASLWLRLKITVTQRGTNFNPIQQWSNIQKPPSGLLDVFCLFAGIDARVICNLGRPAELSEVSMFAEITDPFLIFVDPADPIRRDFPLTYNCQSLLWMEIWVRAFQHNLI